MQILMKKNAVCKTKNFYLLLAFLLITIVTHLLPYYVTNDKLINDKVITVLQIWMAIKN